ncbi:hypothetical protein SAMN05216360_110212 [Methylobacterium phyllostachyos]|uniref:Uncharacterized protein n=1 Tax=Methylobacterium phyllostachyos TaxID=582672 RepID=A0A1H0DLA9_9HYPH|nr:hypothetical protein SAMN05216360_110212 [Methylobacterium phyllostachyos]
MYVHTVIARLKNGSADLTEDPTPILPPAIFQCEKLWQERGRRRSWSKEQWAYVRSAVEPWLYARIEPEDVHRENGLWHSERAIQARSIQLLSCSFENGPLPIISAYAEFQLTFDRPLRDTGELYDWQEQTDWLDWALCFGFRLQDEGEWDATWEHGGIDFELIDPNDAITGHPEMIVS